MKGADLQVYALAQGPVSIGGYRATGLSGSRMQKNHPTVGRVPAGARIEREVPVDLKASELQVSLRSLIS